MFKSKSLSDIMLHLAGRGDGRSVALSKTMAEYGLILVGPDLTGLKAGFELAGRIVGEGPIGARSATCREIAEMIDCEPSSRDGAIQTWEKLITGYERLRDASEENARGRFDAILGTLRRELETF